MNPVLDRGEYWSAEDAARELGIPLATLRGYISRAQPKSNPPPAPVAWFGPTAVYRADDWREWHAARPGRGWRRQREDSAGD